MACFGGHDRGSSISRCLYDKWPPVATNWICSSVRLADQLGKLILHGCILTYGNCSPTVTVGFCTKWQIVDSFSTSCKQNCCTTILITIDVLHRFTSYHLLQGTRHNPSYHDRSMCYNSPWPCPFTPLSLSLLCNNFLLAFTSLFLSPLSNNFVSSVGERVHYRPFSTQANNQLTTVGYYYNCHVSKRDIWKLYYPYDHLV